MNHKYQKNTVLSSNKFIKIKKKYNETFWKKMDSVCKLQLLITIDNLDTKVFSFLKENNIQYIVPYKGLREDILVDNELVYQELILEKMEKNPNDPLLDLLNKDDIEEVRFNNLATDEERE